MKKVMLVMAAVISLAGSALADDFAINLMTATMAPESLINWKVGDTANYNVGFMGMGNIGTMVKSVTKDEGEALWMKQDMSLMGQKQVVEALINKADGKVLKMIANGQEQQVPNDPPEIISQEYTSITVPAGTFKVLHVVAKTSQSPKIEVWANPKDIVMDGAAKQTVQSQMGEISMELTSQKHAD